MSADAVALFEALFGGCESGFVELRPIKPGGGALRPEFFPVAELERAAARALELRERAHVYFGVAPRSREAGTKDAVGPVRARWADCDDAEAAAALRGFALPPTAVVASGSGRHAYWRLEEPLAPAEAESLLRRLATALGADERATDAGRILRVPGTLNHKADPPAPVRLLELHADRVYPVDELDACLPDDRQGDVAGRSTSKPAGPSAAVERLLERLDGVVEAASGWRALCPAHDDHEPSLSVTVGRDGCCLVCCHAGCGVEAIVAAVGLELPDLFDDGPSGGRRKSAKLVALADASGLELFRTPGGRAHASFPVDGHRETWPLRSYGMEWWLRRLRFERSREPLAAEVVAETLATFEAQAQFDGDEREVHRRVAAADGGVVIDVGDSAWRTIEVSAGGWRLLDGAAVPFVRDRSTLPLAEPVEGGSIDELRAFVNCSDERSWLLLVGSLLMCSNPRGPYPIIYPTGEQGSAKSTLSRLIVSLVDPRRAPLAMGTPSVRDLAAIADSVWLVGFDNVSHIPPALSDALCQLVTGAGYRARQLYTDTDSVALDLKRPVLINGIGQVAVRPDLIDRVALIELAPIAPRERRGEGELLAAWERARPRIFGALLDAVATALARLDEVELAELPRLADFARWVEAAAPAFGWPPGTFTAALSSGREELLEGSADAHPEIGALIKLMDARRGEPWTGTAGELLELLTHQVDDKVVATRGWPRRADALSNRPTEYAPLLRQKGVEIERGREPGGTRKRYLRITSSRDTGTRRDA